MKKFLALCLALAMAMSLVACGAAEDAAEGTEATRGGEPTCNHVTVDYQGNIK